MARICDVCASMPARPYYVAVGRDKGASQADPAAPGPVSKFVDLCDRCRRNLDVGLEVLTGEKRGNRAAFMLSCELFEQRTRPAAAVSAGGPRRPAGSDPGSENSLPGRDAS